MFNQSIDILKAHQEYIQCPSAWRDMLKLKQARNDSQLFQIFVHSSDRHWYRQDL